MIDGLENSPQGATKGDENSPRISTETVQPVLPVQSYTIEDIFRSVMKDEQGNNLGYFTLDDWKFKLTFLPVQHPLHCDDENQAEQTLYARLEEGKIIEIEPGKYKPRSP